MTKLKTLAFGLVSVVSVALRSLWVLGVVLAASMLLPVSVWAGGLSLPLAFDSAQVLPKGVRNVRYSYLNVQARRVFDDAGQVASLGNALNTDVNYQKLIDAQPTAIERGLLKGYFARHNKDLTASAGRTTGVIEVDAKVHVPVLAWGLSKNWTTALAVPVLQTRARVATGFVVSQDLQSTAEKLVGEGKYYMASEIRSKTRQVIADKVVDYKYKPLRRRRVFQLGDARWVNKYILQKNNTHSLALVGELVLPTGRRHSVDEVIGLSAGDGQVDVGLGAVGEYRVAKNIVAWGRVHGVYQAGDQVAMRVPEEADSSLSRDIDPQTKRQLGASLYSSLGLAVDVVEGVAARAQYTFQMKQRDVYRGSRFERHRYGWLSQNTAQRMQAMQLGVGYSTVPLFRKKKFVLPLEANAQLVWPLAGKNVSRDKAVSFEVAAYF